MLRPWRPGLLKAPQSLCMTRAKRPALPPREVKGIAVRWLLVSPVKIEHCAQQHVGAVFDVLGLREFFGGMADAGDAGDKDHAHGADAGYLLSVMSGATGHRPGG